MENHADEKAKMWEKEHSLVRKAKAGDRAAFDELIAGQLEMIKAIVARLYWAGSGQTKEDIADDIREKVWKNIGQLENEDRFHGWLGSLSRNHCLDLLRAKRRHQRLLEKLHERQMQEQQAAERERLDASINARLERCYNMIIERIPSSKDRLIFQWRMRGLEYKEIADKIKGMTANNASVRFYRYIKPIMEQVRRECAEDAEEA